MRFILYGTRADKEKFEVLLAALPEWHYRKVQIIDHSDYDGFVAGISAEPSDGIVISMNGAEGMEGVIAARSACENTPVLWFSDDNGFGVQSYRLGCAYFHEKPVSPQILSAAIAKCI